MYLAKLANPYVFTGNFMVGLFGPLVGTGLR
jgi:hypothetical protein